MTISEWHWTGNYLVARHVLKLLSGLGTTPINESSRYYREFSKVSLYTGAPDNSGRFLLFAHAQHGQGVRSSEKTHI